MYTTLKHFRLIFMLLTTMIAMKSAMPQDHKAQDHKAQDHKAQDHKAQDHKAQDQKGFTPSLIKPSEAVARMSANQAREAEAYTLGVQTVMWGMQWVKAAQTMRVAAWPLPQGTPGIPIDPTPHGINTWGHAQELLTHEIRVIETPNTETLYSVAIVDLIDGPVVIVHPEFGERYYRTSVWELHGDTHTISQMNDGANPSAYVLLPSNWTGKVPDGLKPIMTRSRYVLISPHLAVYGSNDLPNVHALQNGFKLIALEDWGKTNKECEPGRPMRPLRRDGTETPAELLFFEELCETLKDLTLREDEIAFARQAGGIGITLNDGFDFMRLDSVTVAGLKRAVADAQSIVEYKARTLAPIQPGGTWMVSYDMTSLDDWLFRAAVGWKNVWGDLPQEVLFPVSRIDMNGKPLNGEHLYQLHFAAGELPPSRYWRISLYDNDGFFTNNPIRRYGIGNMAEKLKSNPDGSLTLYIQHDSPGKENETNWLPAPKEEFFLMMRMYQPSEKLLQGAYILPPLQEVK